MENAKWGQDYGQDRFKLTTGPRPGPKPAAGP